MSILAVIVNFCIDKYLQIVFEQETKAGFNFRFIVKKMLFLLEGMI